MNAVRIAPARLTITETDCKKGDLAILKVRLCAAIASARDIQDVN